MSDVLRVAYHESGHVMVGTLLGLRLMDVDIERDADGGNGHTNFAPPSPREAATPEFVERVVTTFLAGFVAEARFVGERSWDGSGWDVDMLLRDWLRRLSPDERVRRRHLERLLSRAEKLLDNEPTWQMVESVAQALAEKRHLTVAEVESLLISAGPSRGSPATS